MRAGFVAVTLAMVVSGGAAAECPTFKGVEMPAAHLVRILDRHGCVTLEGGAIAGDLIYLTTTHPTITISGNHARFLGTVLLPATNVTFQCDRCEFHAGMDATLAHGTLRLTRSSFKGTTDLQFFRGSVSLAGSDFADPVRLASAKLTVVNLADARFRDGATFSGARIEKLIGTKVAGAIDIRWEQFGADWLKQVRPVTISEAEYVVGELSFWQRNAKTFGYDRDVTAITAEIARLRRKKVMRMTEVEYWQSLASDSVNGYGARPFRPTWYGAVIVAAFAIAYTLRNPFVPTDKSQRPRRPLLLFALCFSLDTFLPAIEVTGVRKWGWGLRDDWRWIELLERLLGVLLTAILAYSVGSAFI